VALVHIHVSRVVINQGSTIVGIISIRFRSPLQLSLLYVHFLKIQLSYINLSSELFPMRLHSNFAIRTIRYTPKIQELSFQNDHAENHV